MELDTARAVADHVSDTLSAVTPSVLGDRRGFLFDGSAVLLPPLPNLRAAFPPAANQHGESPFPVPQLVVAHGLSSGLALRLEYGPLYGPAAVGEVALAQPLLERLPTGSLVLGDRNFGVFAFAWAAAQAGHSILLRLTRPRFAALVKKPRGVGPGRWQLTWRPASGNDGSTRNCRRRRPCAVG